MRIKPKESPLGVFLTLGIMHFRVLPASPPPYRLFTPVSIANPEDGRGVEAVQLAYLLGSHRRK
jgi:hypothetical protein